MHTGSNTIERDFHLHKIEMTKSQKWRTDSQFPGVREGRRNLCGMREKPKKPNCLSGCGCGDTKLHTK